VLKLIVAFLILLLLISFGVLGIVLRGLLGVLLWLRGGARPRRRAGDDTVGGRARSGIGPRSGGGRRAAEPERMVACVVCGVHVPESEAVRAAGELFCCEEHRRARRETGGQDGQGGQ
jgi:uncharacterized protein